jgi:2,5-diketo-D-gluconate reductase B
LEFVQIGDTQVPALGLGTWLLSGSTCRRAVGEALAFGYRLIDTAQMYGNEDDIGHAVAASGIPRDELWITTKLGNRNHAAARVSASLGDSLRRLGTDYVDLLLIHWPVEFSRLGETLEAMLQLQELGKVRHLGVSNFSSAQFAEARRHAPVANNQVEYHPFLNQKAILDAVRSADDTVTAYSPLARGRVMRDPTLVEIAQDHGTTPAAVTLRWLLDQDAVLAIPKATSAGHLQANLEALVTTLDDEERNRINGLARQERLIDPAGLGQSWD